MGSLEGTCQERWPSLLMKADWRRGFCTAIWKGSEGHQKTRTVSGMLGLRGDGCGGQMETLTSEGVPGPAWPPYWSWWGQSLGLLDPAQRSVQMGHRLIKASTDQQRRFGVNSYVLNIKLMKNQILFQETLFSASPAHAWSTEWERLSAPPKNSRLFWLIRHCHVTFWLPSWPSWHTSERKTVLFSQLSFVGLHRPSNRVTDWVSLNSCLENGDWGSWLTSLLTEALPISVELNECRLASYPWMSGRSLRVRKPCLSPSPILSQWWNLRQTNSQLLSFLICKTGQTSVVKIQ